MDRMKLRDTILKSILRDEIEIILDDILSGIEELDTELDNDEELEDRDFIDLLLIIRMSWKNRIDYILLQILVGYIY